MKKVRPGIYRHYKGRDYEVYGVAVHSETEEKLVVYRSLYGNYRLNVRPLKMFFGNVEIGKYKGSRFVLVQEFNDK